jgi:hypothetical protein
MPPGEKGFPAESGGWNFGGGQRETALAVMTPKTGQPIQDQLGSRPMLRGFLKKSPFLNLVMLITSCLVAVILVELLLRVFIIKDFKPSYYLFMSKPALQDQETAFGFKENTLVREAAVTWYGSRFDIIYDTSFTTNTIGLVQKKPFDPKKEALVLVGDSFTQGSGAVPWFYRLEEQWQNSRYQLINLGIMGTGIEQWQVMLRWFASLGKMKHIFICFITDDWKRRRCVVRDNQESTGFNFIPWSRRKQIVNNLTIYYIDKDLSREGLLHQAEIIRNNDRQFSLKKFFKSYQMIESIITRKAFDLKQDRIIHNNKLIFEQIVADYGRQNISLFHIPERGEAMQGTYSPGGQEIREFILSQHLVYIDGLALCGLTAGDYHEQDGHPNASGYEKIYQTFVNQALSNMNLQN